MNVFTLMAQLDLNSDQFNQGLQRAEGRGRSFGQKFGGAMRVAGKAALGVTAAVAGAGAAALAAGDKFAAQADQIDKASSRAGVSAEEYQEMTFALGQLGGISEQTAERGIGRLNQRIGRAAEGNEKYRQALQDVGVVVEAVDNGTISASQAMDQAITNLGNMEDSTQRAALAGELFGTKVGRDLQPAIEAGGEAFASMRDRAHEAGAVMSDEGVAAGVKFADQMDEVQNMLNSVWREIMMELMPILNDFLGWVRENFPAIKAFVSDAMEGIATVWNDILKPAFEAIRPLLEGVILPLLSSLVQNGFMVLQGIIETIGALLRGDFAGAWQGIKKILEGVVMFVGDTLNMVWGGAADAIRNSISQFTSAAESVSRAILTVLTAIPQAVFSIGRNLVTKLIDGLRSVWEFLTNAARDLRDTMLGPIRDLRNTLLELGANIISHLIDGIRNALDRLSAMAGNIASTVWSQIEDLPGRLFNLGSNLIQGLIDGIQGRIEDASDAVRGLWARITRTSEEAAEIESPSKVFMRHGRAVGEGMAVGIRQSTRHSVSAVKDMARQINSEFDQQVAKRDWLEGWLRRIQDPSFSTIHIRISEMGVIEQLRAVNEQIAGTMNQARNQMGGPAGMGPTTTPDPASSGTSTTASFNPNVLPNGAFGMARTDRQAQRSAEQFERATNQFSDDVRRLSLANLRY